jgi:uncharacterized membrane protein YfcA
MSLLLLVLAAFAGGAMNAVAGGGSFLTFPALVFAGVPSVAANATSTVALLPGALASAWGYRRSIGRLEGVNFPIVFGVSVVGGLLGSLLLLLTPQRTFDALIPWLLLAATLLFAGGRKLVALLHRRVRLGPVALGVAQFLIAIYGGYFGGAIGILMLALYQIFGMTDLNSMNGLKNLLAATMNAVAAVCFIVAGKIVWAPALAMLASGIAGGYLGAHAAQRAKPVLVRAVIIIIGFTMSAVFFLR